MCDAIADALDVVGFRELYKFELPEFFALKPIKVIPRNVWWSSGDNFTLFYKIRIEILKQLVEETK